MAFNVQVISVEKIKPSSPTPQHLSSHKLCLLDRMNPTVYGSIVLFFTSNSLDKDVHDHLKSSLSITMTQFYPLAGQLQGGNNFSMINCNDEGVSYIAALASIGLPELSNDRQIQPTQLVKLLPSHLHEISLDLADQLLLGVQVTCFSCGGVAIGVSIWHQVGDASTLVSFLKTWSENCGGKGGGTDDAVLRNSIVTDCSSIFPLSDQLEIRPIVGMSLDDLSTNRLLFDASKIASLRAKMGDGMEADQLPTRFEALAALIWGAAIATVNQQDKSLTPSGGKFSYSVIPVEMRKKVNPPLPQHCSGNLIYPAIEKWEMDRAVDYPELARKVRHSIKIVDHEYVLNRPPPNVADLLLKDSGGNNLSSFSSLCRFPFYDIDLGFGKPSWIHPFVPAKGLTLFVDARDGDGIEALVTFSKQDLVRFEQDPGIIEYAKFSPTPC